MLPLFSLFLCKKDVSRAEFTLFHRQTLLLYWRQCRPMGALCFSRSCDWTKLPFRTENPHLLKSFKKLKQSEVCWAEAVTVVIIQTNVLLICIYSTKHISVDMASSYLAQRNITQTQQHQTTPFTIKALNLFFKMSFVFNAFSNNPSPAGFIL